MKALALAVALLLASAGSAAAATPLVSLVRGTEHEIRDAGSRATVVVPIDPARRVDVTKVTAAVVSVALGTREDRALAAAVTPRLVAASGGRSTRLELTLDTDVASAPGIYAVVVDLHRGGRRQRLSLKLDHVAATLQAPRPVVVERTGGFLGLWEADTNVRALRLKETSKKTRLGPLTVEQVDGPTGATPANGTIDFDAVELAPGNKTALSPILAGDFPRGTSTGTLEVDAPQLASAVTVSYEVRDTLHRGWLVVAIALGIALGYLTRVGLKRLIDRAQARGRGWAQLDAIDAELGRRPDAGFQAAALAARTALDAALRRRRATAADIATNVDTAATALTAALHDLEQRTGAVADELAALTATIATPWAAPAPVLTALHAQDDALTAAAAALERGDATAAATAVTSALQALRVGLREPLHAFAAEVRAFLAALAALRLPAAVRPRVAAAAQQVRAGLLRGDFDAPSLDPQRALTGAHAAETALRRLLEDLSSVSLTVAMVLDTLRDAGALSDAAGEQIEHTDRALAAALRERDLVAIPRRADDLFDALRAAIAAPLAGASLADANAKLDAGRYDEAAAIAAAAVEPVLDAAPVAAAARYEPHIVASADRPAAPVLVQGRWRRWEVPAGLARALNTAVLLPASWLRTLLIGLGVVLAGYGVFHSGFVGTEEQLIAAFFWGFASDITAEGLLGLARAGSTPPTHPAAA